MKNVQLLTCLLLVISLIVDMVDAKSMFKKNTVDMSYDFDENTIYFPFTQIASFNLTQKEYPVGDQGDSKRNGNYFAGEHGGTHMDAPMHFYKPGWTIEQIPVERFHAPAVVLDVRDQVAKDVEYSVTVDDLMVWESKHGNMPDNSVVLLCTGWDNKWPDKDAFFGTDTLLDSSTWRFPGFSTDLADFLVANRSVVGIGTDCATPDGSRTVRAGLPIHLSITKSNIYILEYVKDTCAIAEHGASLFIFPMKIKHGSGAPTRVLATWGDDAGDGVCTSGARRMLHSNVISLVLFTSIIVSYL